MPSLLHCTPLLLSQLQILVPDTLPDGLSLTSSHMPLVGRDWQSVAREAGRFSRAIRECPALTSVLVAGPCLTWGCVPVSVRGLGHPDRLSLQRVAGFLVLLLDTRQGIKSLLSKERHLKEVGKVCGSCLNRRLSFLSWLVTCVYRFPMSAAFLTNDTLHLILKKEPVCMAPSPPCPPCSVPKPVLCGGLADPHHRPSCSRFSAHVPFLGFPS